MVCRNEMLIIGVKRKNFNLISEWDLQNRIINMYILYGTLSLFILLFDTLLKFKSPKIK
jgi:hypothetical protein